MSVHPDITLLLYDIVILGLGFGLVVFSYLDRIYRELGRVTTGRLREHLDFFESDIEPQLKLERSDAALAFRLLGALWLVMVTAATTHAVVVSVPGPWNALAEALIYVTLEVLLFAQFLPDFLLVRTNGRWLRPMLPLIRFILLLEWPFRELLRLGLSFTAISEESPLDSVVTSQENLEAFVDAAEQEGILERDEAHMIEQVVEFSDKRILEFMTPRPEVVAIPAPSSMDQLRHLLVETKFSRIPVFEESLDDIIGVVVARDLLEVPAEQVAQRTVRDLARPVMFVPETKRGSELLKEMQRRNQPMAIVVDEHGSVAGVVTVEDLVGEIIGDMGEDDRVPAPDAVREPDGSLILRGSVSLEKVQELFGVEWEMTGEESATTIAGLLNHVAGHVPSTGEHIEYGGLHFEILEANQRKVLRLRARRLPAAVSAQ